MTRSPAELFVGNRRIADDEPVFVVAELSANHGQQLDIALRSVEAAAKAGVDAIKLQTYTPDTLTLRHTSADFVVHSKNEWNGRMLHDLYAEAMTPWEWHRELFSCAHSLGLICFSTPFDVSAIELLEQLEAPVHKVASFELTDPNLIAAVAHTQKPVIASTGMATMDEIDAALRVFRIAGVAPPALLKCVSSYPATAASMNLAGIAALREKGVVVGLSDHSRTTTAAVAAVALGARILEKHFILDRTMGGPDAFFSLDPEELRLTVEAVRDAQAAIGTPRFGPTSEEQQSLAFRRSIYVAKDLQTGDRLTVDNLRSVRPSFGLPPQDFSAVLGQTAARSARVGERLSRDLVAVPSTPEQVASNVSLRPYRGETADVVLAEAFVPTASVESLRQALRGADQLGRAQGFAALVVSYSPQTALADAVVEAGFQPIGHIGAKSFAHRFLAS